MVDGLKEEELGRGSIGTTKKGIGPAYSSKSSRSGLRVHHLINALSKDVDFFESEFATLFRRFVENRKRRYGSFDYNADAELQELKVRVDSIQLVRCWARN